MLRPQKPGSVCIGILSLMVLGFTGCSRERSSAQVAANVQNKIRTDSRMQMARVQVVAAKGVVTLSGYVTSPWQRIVTAQDASQVDGVRVVVDNLQIVDPSSSDANRREANREIIDANQEHAAVAVQKPAAGIPRPGSLPNSSPRDPVATIKPGSVPAVAAPSVAHPETVTQTMSQIANANSAHRATTSTTAAPATPVPADIHALDSNSSAPRTRVWPVSASSVASSADAAPPVLPEQVTVPSGTELQVRLTESLTSDLNEKGDTFLASLASPIVIGDRVVIPAEAGIEGKVVDVDSAGRFSGRPKLAVELTRLTYNGKTYALRSTEYSKQGASRNTRSLATIGGGAGLGAIIGAIIGGGRGAAIGSVLGAGAGTGAQAASKITPVKLPSESVLSFRLQGPLKVMPSSTLQRTQRAGTGSLQDPFSSDDDRPVLKRRPGSPPPETDTETTPHSDNN